MTDCDPSNKPLSPDQCPDALERWYCALNADERGERGSDDLTTCPVTGQPMCTSNKPVPICCKKTGPNYCNHYEVYAEDDCDNSTMPTTPDACDHNGEQVGPWPSLAFSQSRSLARVMSVV